MFPKLRRALCLCLTLVLVTALVVSASASGTYGYGSIEICYEVDDKPISNKEFQLYRVGNVNNDLDFSWTTEYADYNLNLDVTSVEVMHNLPSVLAGYVSRRPGRRYLPAYRSYMVEWQLHVSHCTSFSVPAIH